MRDPRKLRAFELADAFALLVYRATRTFPKDEKFGLTAQVRRAVVSAASNIVEGCARRSEADYVHFLDIAYGSVHEVQYQLSLAHRLGYLEEGMNEALLEAGTETAKVLGALIRSFRTSPP